MNKELSLLMKFTRMLPVVKGAGVFINRLVIPFYTRKPRQMEIVDVKGWKMRVNPHQCIDSGLLFYPQLCDNREINYLDKLIKHDWVVLDIGAHIGFYSLYFASKCKQGNIFSIEADPGNFSHLSFNIKLNPEYKNIQILNVGVSDKNEVLSLGISTTGNTSGNSFLSRSDSRVDVECKPLISIVSELGIAKIDLIKIDIEGFEFRVFKNYFENSNQSIHPTFILLEDNPTIQQEGDTLLLLKEHGYKLVKNFGLNKLMEKSL